MIGTGATGVQTIQEVAKTAGTLTVFQRTPNWCFPMNNMPMPKEYEQHVKSIYPEVRRQEYANRGASVVLVGFEVKLPSDRKVFDVTGGQVLVAYTGAEPSAVPANTNAAIAAHVVFMVGLSDATAHGSYTFTLIDTLDQHGAGEDTLQLGFQFTATDSDGDTTLPATITGSEDGFMHCL